MISIAKDNCQSMENLKIDNLWILLFLEMLMLCKIPKPQNQKLTISSLFSRQPICSEIGPDPFTLCQRRGQSVGGMGHQGLPRVLRPHPRVHRCAGRAAAQHAPRGDPAHLQKAVRTLFSIYKTWKIKRLKISLIMLHSSIRSFTWNLVLCIIYTIRNELSHSCSTERLSHHATSGKVAFPRWFVQASAVGGTRVRVSCSSTSHSNTAHLLASSVYREYCTP